MASDITQQDRSQLDAVASSAAGAHPLTNGHLDHPGMSREQHLNTTGFTENAALLKPDHSLDLPGAAPPQLDRHSAGPTLVEDVAPGPPSSSDFTPKDAAHASHPTPPPDELLDHVDADVDAHPPSVSDLAQPESNLASEIPDTNLVRPREDDDDLDQPAAKRSKFEDDSGAVSTAPEATAAVSITATDLREPESHLSSSLPVETQEPREPEPQSSVSHLHESEPERFTPPPREPRSEPQPSHQMDSPPIQQPPIQAQPLDSLTSSVVVGETPADVPQMSAPSIVPAADLTSIVEPVALQGVTPVIESALSADMTPTVETEPTQLSMPAESAAPTASIVTPSVEAATTTDVEMTSAEPTITETVTISRMEPGSAAVEMAVPAEPVAADTAPTSKVEADPMEVDVKPSVEVAAVPQASAPPAGPVAPPAPVREGPSYSKSAMTSAQNKFLQEKMKNLKKTKNSIAFMNPVDPVAMGIPTYLDIIQTPMDLTTMETKLKNGEYASVQDFANDFDLIISNTRRFNGDAHSVTQAGMAMEAYFRKMMETVPSADQPTLPKPPPPKKMSPKPAPPRRESRSAAAATSPAGGETFALQPDGTPLIRRDSNINRPSRTIKPPANREIAYAKPKRKENQLELKFCEYVLEQIRGPKHAMINSVFLQPVDPVALNIPHYRQVVKTPMDLQTMGLKLKQGQYGKATEFKKDFDLMIANCLSFNPPGNTVRDMGIQLQRAFEELWQSKDKWERGRKADSQRATSASEDDESGVEDEDEDDEEDAEMVTAQAKMINDLQRQIADMHNMIAGLNKPGKTKKPKALGGALGKSKKAGTVAAAPKAKAASKAAAKASSSKRQKQVTYEEKQEISEAVGKMSGPQVEELTRIITTHCKKYADQDEMELEIDDLPNDVQVMLLQYVRKIFGNPRRARAASPADDAAAIDDDDFEPGSAGGRAGGGKRKKHKPMGKKEQQDTISSLQAQLAQFNDAGSTSNSPTNSSFAVANQGAESSGDEESEESEEE